MDIIDEKVRTPVNLDESEVEKKTSLVRDIIINHLDEYYHKKILNVNDPKTIINKIRDFGRVDANVTASSVRAQLYRLKLNKREKINDFCGRFDTIVKEYESCNTSVPLSEEEKRSAFYQAVSYSNSEIRSAYLIRRQTDNKEMTLEEIKSFLLQLEVENKRSDEIRPTAQVAQRAPE